MDSSTYIVTIVINLFEFLIVTKFMNHFLNKKEWHRAFKITGIVGFAFIHFAVNILDTAWLNTASGFILVLVFAVVFYKDKRLKKFALSSTYIAITVASEELFRFIIIVLSGSTVNLQITEKMDQIVGGILSKALCFIFVVILCKVFPDKFRLDKESEILPLTTLPIFGVLAVVIIVMYSNRMGLPYHENLLIVLFTIAMLTTMISVFFIYDGVVAKKDLETQTALYERNQRMSAMLLKEQQKRLQQRNLIIHDFKNHLNHIRKLKGEQAIQYSDALIEEYDKELHTPAFDVHNIVLTNILYGLQDKCNRDNIRLDPDISFNQLSFIGNMDTSELFDNLFDNAYQACLQVEGDRWIQVEIFRASSYYLMITVRNSQNDQVIERDGTFLSYRRHYESPGLGIERIRQVAEKYNGFANFEHDKNSFTAMIRLGIEEVNGRF